MSWINDQIDLLEDSYQDIDHELEKSFKNRNEKLPHEKKRSTHLKTNEIYDQELLEKCPTIKRIGEYKNSRTPILHECLVCGKKHLTTPHNKLKGCGHCGRKNNGSGGWGIPKEEPGITYLVYFPKLFLYKIGVTGRTTELRNDSQRQKYEIILEHYFDTGREAMQLEKEWLINVQPYKLNTGLLNSGNTETFRYDH